MALIFYDPKGGVRMKTVITEWAKDKKAFAYLLTWLLTSLVISYLGAQYPVSIGHIFDSNYDAKESLIITLAIGLIMLICETVGGYLRRESLILSVTSVHRRYINKIIDSHVRLFTKFSCSRIITIQDYTYRIAQCGKEMASAVSTVFSIIAVLYTMYRVGGILIVPVIVVYGFGAVLIRRLFVKFTEQSVAATKLQKIRNQEIEDTVNGFLEVRSFNTKSHHKQKIGETLDGVYDIRHKNAVLTAKINLTFSAIDLIGAFIVIFYCLFRIEAGEMNAAEAMTLVLLVFKVIDPIGGALDMADNIGSYIGPIKEFSEFMAYDATDTDGTIELKSFEKGISLENVSFAYDSSDEVLKDISMTFEKGKKIGICGLSGCGKSTIFKLCNRFYTPSEGNIKIDGIDVRDITDESYRKFISCVHQENAIFPGTIHENVVYGNFHASEAEVIEACKKANIYDFISGLPEKFDTIVGPRGLKLSGGQKQRIALARMFLSNAPIILLDEATSALDNESETLIQEALDKLTGKTVITIAHRLSTIKKCDKIYLLDTDGVKESGTHEELMALKGAYYALQK